MTHVLDVRDLACPLPVLRANKKMRTLDSGEVLEVLATDRSAVQDFQIYCQRTRNELLEWEESSGIFRFRIRKSA